MALYRPSLVALSLRLCEVAGANSRLCIQMTIPLPSSCLPGDPPTRDESSAASEAVTGKRGGLLACLLALIAQCNSCHCPSSVMTTTGPTRYWSWWSCDTHPLAKLSFLPIGTVSVFRYSLLYIENKVSSPELKTRCGKDEGSASTARRGFPGFTRLEDMHTAIAHSRKVGSWSDKGQGQCIYMDPCSPGVAMGS